MAIARQEHHLGRSSRPDRDSSHLEPETAEQRVKNKQRGSISSRISLILASMMLGAATGWMIFRAVLTLITLD
jgi:hypothetical protein